MAWPGWVPTELVQAIRADGGYPLDIGSMEHQLFIKCLNAIIHADDWGVHGSRHVFVDFLFDRAGMLLRGSGQSRVDPPPDGTDSPLMHALTVQPFTHQAFFVKVLLQHGADVNRVCASDIPQVIANAKMPSLLAALRYMPGHPDFGDYPDLGSLSQVDLLDASHSHLLDFSSSHQITTSHAAEQMQLLNGILQGSLEVGQEWPPLTRAATVLELGSYYFCMDSDDTEPRMRPIVTALAAEALPHQAWVLKTIMASSSNQGHSIDVQHTVLGGRTPRKAADDVLHGLLVELCDA